MSKDNSAVQEQSKKLPERDPAVFCLWARTARKSGKKYWVTTINDKEYVVFANADGHMFAHLSSREGNGKKTNFTI